ncbi:MAG: YigZ family protein [Bacteroidales bacterium]|nr:YigZ family protein [Bacteroidales bacterium]
MKDTYKTITKQSTGFYKDKGSKFIAEAVPVDSEEKVKESLDRIKNKYHDARHHCYAYCLGFDKSVYRTNDDGEPSGTAGKPIYGQIRSKDLTNILIVVIRYFGGTKLGVRGLINAYKAAAQDSLENTNIVTKTVNDLFRIDFQYPLMNDVMRIIKEENLQQSNQKFEISCSLEFFIRKKYSKKIFERFNKINNLEITYLRTE